MTDDSLTVTSSYSLAMYAVPTYDVMPKFECRVYWGSHGCDLPRGHAGHHRCDCADSACVCCGYDDCVHKVGAFPFYGPDTMFYGEDASESERGAWA